jgi:Calx-beta domain-containing protein
MRFTPRRAAAAEALAGAQPETTSRRARRLARILAAVGAVTLPAAGVLAFAGPAFAGGSPPPGYYITPTSVVSGPGDPMTFRSYTYSLDGKIIDTTATTQFTLDGQPCAANVCSSDVPGTHTVTAMIVGWNPTATVTVLAPDHLAISPGSTQATAGDTVNYAVTRVTADGTAIDNVTTGATVTVDGTPCPSAACLATTAGQHTVTATYSGQVNGTTQSWTGSTALSVLPGPPANLSLTPGTNPVAPGVADSFHAEAYDAEGNDLGDVTSSTTFAISPDGSCQASACTAAVGGPHTVTATYGQATGTAALTVLPALKAGSVTTTGSGSSHVIHLPLTLSTASSQPVTVYWHTKDGTATAGTDYAAVSSGTVTIPAGSTRAKVAVTILQDPSAETSEQFTVVLTAANWASISKATGTITITN